MRADLILSLVLVAIALLVVTVLGAQLPRQPRMHLCGVAEISPDITPKERELCRQARRP